MWSSRSPTSCLGGSPWALLPFVAVSARRLQDTGKSGWLAALYLIPFVGFIVVLILCMFKGDEGPNHYGPPPGEED